VQLLSDYLNSKGCTYTAFLMAILDVVLTENYCFFAGYYWKQFVGFATGVACGSEVANLFLFALFEPVFSDPRFMKYLIYNKRYIDDCVLIWSGSTELLHVMIARAAVRRRARRPPRRAAAGCRGAFRAVQCSLERFSSAEPRSELL
jgi:hypothetical protein